MNKISVCQLEIIQAAEFRVWFRLGPDFICGAFIHAVSIEVINNTQNMEVWNKLLIWAHSQYEYIFGSLAFLLFPAEDSDTSPYRTNIPYACFAIHV